MSLRLAGAVALLCLVSNSAPGVVHAETLFDAISLAYESNPSLRGQRAQLRGVDEHLVQARAGYGPTVALTGQGGYQDALLDQQNFIGGFTNSHLHAATGQVDLSVTQPIYTGGAVDARVQGASAEILSGREGLRRAEGQLLLQVVTAYVDVRRDRESLKILTDEIDGLTADVREVSAKGQLGQLTLTDVAQAQSRLLTTQSQLELARAKLRNSSAVYLNLVGHSPGELAPEPDLPGLPANVDKAFDIAEANSPELRQAIQAELSARAKVTEARTANSPTVALKLDGSIAPIAPYLPRQYDKSLTAEVTYTQTLYSGGLYASRLREALEDDTKAALDVEVARRNVVQALGQAWDQYLLSRRALEIQAELLKSEALAVRGNHVEERVGLRSTIDMLNAELELSNAKLTYAGTRHDAYVASANVLAAMGLMEARLLAPGAAPYRPEASLRKVILDAPPWVDAVGAVDRLGAPRPTAPITASLTAGGTRPAADPALQQNPSTSQTPPEGPRP